MKKNIGTITVLVVAVGVIAGMLTYNHQMQQEEPADDVIAVNTEPEKEIPEPEPETPEAPEDDSEAEEDGAGIVGDFVIDPETGLLVPNFAAPSFAEQYGFDEMTEEEQNAFVEAEQKRIEEEANKSVEEILEELGMGEGQGQGQTQEETQGQGDGQGQQQQQQQTSSKEAERLAEELRKIAEATGAVTGDVVMGEANDNISHSGPGINWG